MVRLPYRVGLIVARQEGAKQATGDVIVVLDSHVEVMTNWLPPLLGELLLTADQCPLISLLHFLLKTVTSCLCITAKRRLTKY